MYISKKKLYEIRGNLLQVIRGLEIQMNNSKNRYDYYSSLPDKDKFRDDVLANEIIYKCTKYWKEECEKALKGELLK